LFHFTNQFINFDSNFGTDLLQKAFKLKEVTTDTHGLT